MAGREPVQCHLDADLNGEGERDHMCADTFGVGIHLTDEELQFVVHVPSDVDSGWTDPGAFQSLVAETVWDELDQQTVLGTIANRFETGTTVTLGTVTLEPGGAVVKHDLSVPDPDADDFDSTPSSETRRGGRTE